MFTVLVSCSIAVIMVLALFRLLTFVSMRRNRLTGPLIANIMERHLQGIDDPADWDQFTAIPIADKKLDGIRLQCFQMDNPSALLLGELDDFRLTIEQLKRDRE